MANEHLRGFAGASAAQTAASWVVDDMLAESQPMQSAAPVNAAADAAARVVADLTAGFIPAAPYDPAAIDRAINDDTAILNRALENLKPKRGGGVTRPASWTQQAAAAPQKPTRATVQAQWRERLDALSPGQREFVMGWVKEQPDFFPDGYAEQTLAEEDLYDTAGWEAEWDADEAARNAPLEEGEL